MPAERTLLTRLNEPDEKIEARMISALDALLIDPPRKTLQAGETLFRQDDELDGIYILLDGQVKLYQLIDDQEVIFHAQTTGRILGLLALTRRSRSFFSCRAVTQVTVLKVGFDDLDQALQQSESLLVTFIMVLMRSMARRSTRLVELQREVVTLNKSLSRERDALARTLRELQQAQGLLVESEKMATLGQLAAGVAHELNNPIAAINRAADFIQEDLMALVTELPDGAVFEDMLRRGLEVTPRSTAEQRAQRRALSQALKDEDLADMLVQVGISDAAEFQRIAKKMPGDPHTAAERMQSYHQLGGALRNISSCSDRITDLVKSLRSYARADNSEDQEADLHEGLEDTLRLFSNRLRNVTVERHYADIPTVKANPGPLNQVWTNLIANALDAMKDQGTLTVATELGEDEVIVRVIDSGPGIAPEHLKRIFDLRFTTRQGRVEFGLGLGLSISQSIISRQGGTLSVESEPGRTAFSVCLPWRSGNNTQQENRSASL